MFRAAYENAARRLDRELVGTAPSRAQLHRWTSGELRRLPYTDHCRVLETMFPGWTAEQLFGPCPDDVLKNGMCTEPPADHAVGAPLADVTAVFPTRAEFASRMPPHAMFDEAKKIQAAGLSLNLICQQYPDQALYRLIEGGTELRCLFLDPDGEAIREREREEGYSDHHLVMLTRLNIEVLARLRGRLPDEARRRLSIAVYDETIRFGLVLIDGETCVMQPYLPQARGVDSPTFVMRRGEGDSGLYSALRADLYRFMGTESPCMTASTGVLLPAALEAVGLANDLFRSRAPGMLTAKGDRDMATELDYAVERAVRAHLRARTPAVPILGEEEGVTGAGGGDLLWAIDPIDGTANFVHGLPLCGISLGLVRRDRPVLGVIDLPLLGARYWAVEHEGTHLGDRRIATSGTGRLRDAVVAIGDYAVGPDARERNRLRLALTEQLAARAQRVRMLGSAAIDLAWVAHGRLDVSLTMSNKTWDTAAGVIIAREAGAVVIDQDGTDHTSDSAATIAAAPGVVDEIVSLVMRTRDGVAQAR